MRLYYEQAEQIPGPNAAQYAVVNKVEGVILHSMEGYRAGARAQLVSGTVSWHFSVYKDGTVEQHYPLDASCWHAGTSDNLRLVGVEHEGVAGEPFTEAQFQASYALTKWIAIQGGWGFKRGETLFEHHEINPRTTCPNGRIPWWRFGLERVDVVTHTLSSTEQTQAGRAIGYGAGLALSGVDGRSVEIIIDPDTPIDFVDYRVRVRKGDAERGV